MKLMFFLETNDFLYFLQTEFGIFISITVYNRKEESMEILRNYYRQPETYEMQKKDVKSSKKDVKSSKKYRILR